MSGNGVEWGGVGVVIRPLCVVSSVSGSGTGSGTYQQQKREARLESGDE